MRDKLVVAAVLGFAVITACVQLPDRDSSSAPARDEPASAELPVNTTAVTGQQAALDGTEPAQVLIPEAEMDAAPEPDSNSQPESLATSSDNGFFLPYVNELCSQIGNKLGSVSVEDCGSQNFVFGGSFSSNQRPLVIKEITPLSRNGKSFRVFLMGGIHGDEYSSISIIFKWLQLFSPTATESDFYWRIAPLVNPDGLLDEGQAKRQNANGVDLNRNFPSLDWNDSAAEYWQESTGSNPRRFPGSSAASEPEVKWVVQQIEEFEPDVIVSIHAPYHLLDFDGPAQAPHQIGELYLHQLGVYPGSLGNYAGINKRIPVVTLELPSAGILPPADQIQLMWLDLIAWLDTEGRKVLTN